MSDEFKFTQNSARSVANAATDSIMSRQRSEAARAAGATEYDVVKAALGTDEEIAELGKVICIIALFRALGEFYGLVDPVDQAVEEPLENLAYLGYMATIQHYVDSEPAKRWAAFYDAAQTNGDVLTYFLTENERNDDVIRYHSKYDHHFFQQWKEMSIGAQFALNRTDYDELIAQAERESAEAEARLRQEGKL